MPVLLAPAGLARLVHPEGELAAARAAGAAGNDLLRLDRIQLRDRGDRGRRDGAAVAAALPVAQPCRGRGPGGPGARGGIPRARAHDRRPGRRQPRARRPQRRLAAAPPPPRHGPRRAEAAALARRVPPRPDDHVRKPRRDRRARAIPARSGRYVDRELNDPTATWERLDWLRRLWDGPLVVKGVLSVRDAEEAVRRGADAVYVSNHGGRQLDGSPATLDVLAAVVEAVGDRAEVLLDGGVRRGEDVVKARALGARACLVGRPWFMGLAAGGRAGRRAHARRPRPGRRPDPRARRGAEDRRRRRERPLRPIVW